ncbi:MAG: hypothetical protein ABW066_15055 [Sedimenticola sp.]
MAQEAESPLAQRHTVPSNRQIAVMIKSAVVAFNHANLTGNYSVLRDLAAPSFRDQNSSASLAEIFQKLRKRKVDLGPIILYQPKLPRKPWINQRGLLRVVGFFATRPEQVNFNLAYTMVGNRWALFSIGITTSHPKAIPGG